MILIEVGKEGWIVNEYRCGKWQRSDVPLAGNTSQIIGDLRAKSQLIFTWIEGMPWQIDAIYERLYPVHIIICPQSLFQLIDHSYLYEMEKGQEEAAVTLEHRMRQEYVEVQLFLKGFYQKSNRVKAYYYYENWQLIRSLNNVLGNRLVDIISIYEEEVFNFFRYQWLVKSYLSFKESKNTR